MCLMYALHIICTNTAKDSGFYSKAHIDQVCLMAHLPNINNRVQHIPVACSILLRWSQCFLYKYKISFWNMPPPHSSTAMFSMIFPYRFLAVWELPLGLYLQSISGCPFQNRNTVKLWLTDATSAHCLRWVFEVYAGYSTFICRPFV